MATITAGMVKELREKTGAGMMDCKKALAETDGDMEKAVDELRKRGQAIADKRGGRAMKEGLIVAKVEGNVGVLIELNCETDFVARNEEFKTLAANLAELVFAGGEAVDTGDAGKVGEAPFPQYAGKPVEEVVRNLIAKIGENLAFTRFIRFQASQPEGAGHLVSYIHPPGKLGVLVEFALAKAETVRNEIFAQMAKDIAMHVAAAAPVSLVRGDIPAALMERERTIYADQARMEGKPEKIWDKIIEGKMAKFYKQSCLTEQEFVRDPDQTIAKLIETVGKQAGDTIRVSRFARFEVGGASPAEEKAE